MSSTGFIKNGRYVRSPDVDPSLKNPQEHSAHREYVRGDMANTYRKDLIQPRIGEKPNPEFIAAFPEKAELYFTSEQINEAKKEL